jgi:hypothetical protein
MSKRIDITNHIFNDIYVLKFERKKTNYMQELDIKRRLLDGESITGISRDLELSRGVIYRVKKEWQNSL